MDDITFMITVVAPHVGAWIETAYFLFVFVSVIVAPHVGAWIETTTTALFCLCHTCRPSRGGVD